MRYIRLALLVVFVIPVVALLAQTSFTSVRGTIADNSGAMIPNAQVSLKNTATNAELTGSSDSGGLFQFAQVTPGTYTITVTASGFAPSTKQAQLLVNQPATDQLPARRAGQCNRSQCKRRSADPQQY